MRRGLQLEALKEFILSQGASKNITLQDWEKVRLAPACSGVMASVRKLGMSVHCSYLNVTEHGDNLTGARCSDWGEAGLSSGSSAGLIPWLHVCYTAGLAAGGAGALQEASSR